MWANLHLLFWQSLIPFVTGWMGENHFAALYGFVLLMSAIAYLILQSAVVAKERRESLLAGALGRGYKGKLSLACYVIAIRFSLVKQWLADLLYVLVAMMRFMLDLRIGRALGRRGK